MKTIFKLIFLFTIIWSLAGCASTNERCTAGHYETQSAWGCLRYENYACVEHGPVYREVFVCTGEYVCIDGYHRNAKNECVK